LFETAPWRVFAFFFLVYVLFPEYQAVKMLRVSTVINLFDLIEEVAVPHYGEFVALHLGKQGKFSACLFIPRSQSEFRDAMPVEQLVLHLRI